MIHDTQLVSESFVTEFERALQEKIASWNQDFFDLDIRFSTSHAVSGRVRFSALIIVHNKSERSGKDINGPYYS